jgi:FkbM family methyltransferase
MPLLVTISKRLYRILGPENSTRLAHSKLGKVAYALLNRKSGVQIYTVDQGIRLQLTKDEAMFMGIYYLGQLNPFESEFIKRNLKKGELFIDVGTFVDGWHSLLAATMGARVVAFEPAPEYAQRFKKQVELNDLAIKIETVALSDRNGRATFYDAGGASSFSKDHGELIHNTFASKAITVTTKTLDSYELKPAMVKIDVEGFEMRVLRGARKTLAKYKPTLIMELEEGFLREAGSSEKEVLSFLVSLGYSFWMFSRDGKLIPYGVIDKAGMNLICVNKSRSIH